MKKKIERLSWIEEKEKVKNKKELSSTFTEKKGN